MRKLNLPWLSAIVLGSLSLGTAGFVLHEFQMWRNAPSFLRAAERAKATDHPEAAANYLSRYVKLAPHDNEGLILYGLQLADLNNTSVAYLTLERAIQRQPSRNDVRRRLVGLAMQLGRFADAIDHLRNHLLKDSPEDAELWEQLSVCQFARGEFKEAEAALESAIAHAPDRLEAYLKLASLRHEIMERPEDALKAINQMVSQNVENHLAYLARAQWLMQRLRQSKSEQSVNGASDSQAADRVYHDADADAKRALALAPESADAIAFAAMIAQAAGRTAEARELAQSGLRLHSSDSRFYTILAQLESISGNETAAVDLMRQSVAANPKDFGLKWNLANILVDRESYGEVQQLIRQLREAKLPEVLILYLEARMKIRRHEWLAAIEQLAAIRPGLTELPVLLKQADFWLGVAYRETNSLDQQLDCFRRAVALDPDWVPARFALAESLISANLLQEASNEYKQILSKLGAPASAAVGLAKTSLSMNLRKNSKQQNWGDFDEVLRQIEQQDSLETQVAILRMEKLVAKQDREAAAKIISTTREKHVDRFELWVAQIALAQSTRDWESVEKLLSEIEKQFGDTPGVRLLKGRYLVQRYAAEATDSLRKLAEPLSTWTEEQRIQAARDLAPLFLSIGAFDETEKLATLVGQAEPGNLRSRLLLLDVALRAQRPNLLDQTLEEVRSIAGEGAIWHYGQATRLALIGQEDRDPKNITEALAHLRKARAERPTWDRIPLLMAELCDQQQDTRGAIEYYLESIRLGVQSPLVSNRAIVLLFNSQRFDEAAKLIQQLHDTKALFTDEMARYEISIALRLGRKVQAKEALESFLDTPQQTQDPKWLGQVYAALENYAAAEEQFRLAIQENRSAPQAWLSLVQILVASKQPEKAELVVEEAKTKITADQKLLTVGQCYEILGKSELAREAYQAALKQSPESFFANQLWIEFLMKLGATADAELALKNVFNLLTGADENSQANRMWVQRKLATVLLTQGSYGQLTQGLTIVQKNIDQSIPPSSDDLRLKAVILSNLPSRAQRQQAISVLEKLLLQESTSESETEDRFLLSKLYLRAGNRTKARIELRKAINARQEEPRFIAAYVQLCLQSDELSEAEIYFDRLQKLTPKATSTLDLKAQILFKKGKYLQVVDLLKTISAPSKNELDANESYETRILWSARRFDEFANHLNQANQSAEAKKFTAMSESLYTEFTRLRPEETLVLAEFLAGTPQIDRALDLLSEDGSKSSAGRVAGVAFALRKNTNATPTQLARLQELLDQNFEKNETSTLLQLASADLKSWCGNYRGASNLYREILGKDRRNVAALNNLAFVLSLSDGDQDEALRLVENAIEYGGPMDSLIDTRGQVHLAAGHPEQAIVDFEQAIRENETAERRFHEANAFARLKQLQMAKQSLDRAVVLGLSEKELYPAERTALQKLREQLLLEENPK